MSTVNLGRVKPIYKGSYSASTAYLPLDFVKYTDGLTYFCILATTAGTAPGNSTYWQPVTDNMQSLFDAKVDKVTGKGLSTNDFTNAAAAVIAATSGTNTGDETMSSIKTKLGISTLSGSNTGDQDLSGLVSKVTSTDNAIVRFDGTSGAVQNSGAILDDSGNLGLGVTPSASTLRGIDISTSGGFVGTSSSAIVTNNTFWNGSNWIYKNAATAGYYTVNGSTHAWYTAPSGTAGNPITFTQAMTLDASGELMIGYTTPTAGRALDVRGGNVFLLGIHAYGSANETTDTAQWTVRANQTKNGCIGFTEASVADRWAIGIKGGDASLIFASGSNNIGIATERMRLDSSGNLLVGTTSAHGFGRISTVVGSGANGLGVNQTDTGNSWSCLYLNRTGSDGREIEFNRNGTFVGSVSVTASATAYNTSSDYRLKENIQPMQNALGVVAQLNPVTYTWKVDGSDGQGFIAHELQAVVPDCVTGEKDAVDAEGKPVYQGVDTSFLVATLTAAIQEQQAMITELKARIEQLENK